MSIKTYEQPQYRLETTSLQKITSNSSSTTSDVGNISNSTKSMLMDDAKKIMDLAHDVNSKEELSDAAKEWLRKFDEFIQLNPIPISSLEKEPNTKRSYRKEGVKNYVYNLKPKKKSSKENFHEKSDVVQCLIESVVDKVKNFIISQSLVDWLLI